jgi:hypothetical protein
MNIGQKAATALRGFVLFLSITNNKQFLANNTTQKLALHQQAVRMRMLATT